MRTLQLALAGLCVTLTGYGCAAPAGYLAAKAEHAPETSLAATTAQPPNQGPVLAAIEPQPAAAQRLIIYSGLLQLVVSDIAQTLETIRAHAIAQGGYLQEQDGNSIIVRVPAAKFQDAVATYSRLGVITASHIKAQDVTEEMRDLRIRLENALQTRTRLLAHLEKSTKAEDTLKIEQELDRVTQTVELLKGKLQSMESQLAYSVLKVVLNSPLPQQKVNQVPFAWVRNLGEAVISGNVAVNADTSRRERRAIRFDPPASYIRFYDRDDVSETMSADGVILRIQKQDNYPGGDVVFWTKLARRTLVENRVIAFDAEQDVASRDKAPGRMLVGKRDLAGQKSGYLLALFVTEDGIYAAEAWGPLAAFEKDREALIGAVKTLEAKR